MIAGFGGRDAVAAQAQTALDADDLRWAAELATWLVVTPDASDDDRARLAEILRRIGQRSPAANIRNWCLTTARDLDGTAPLARHRTHRFRRGQVLADPVSSLRTLRVLLDPDRALGIDHHVAFSFDDGVRVGVHVRNCVAVPTDGADATSSVHISNTAWAEVLTGARAWASVVSAGDADVKGSAESVASVMACFDLPSPRVPA